ncbi:MAG: pyridoxamine 5'-phosphate oxidase [Chloroflexota bacterium]
METVSPASRESNPSHLDKSSLNPNPLLQFEAWFKTAQSLETAMPEAMTLATATLAGQPSARIVLMRGLNAESIIFYTNYQSRKGEELAQNQAAAAVFWWPNSKRQVRFEGIIEKVEAAISDAYFNNRPRGHRISTWVSHQSQPVANRQDLETRTIEIEATYEGQDVPRPPYWGGYRLTPHTMEFWQNSANRLHHRFRYKRDDDGWMIERLAP